jgi:hypothetical protein
VRLIQRTALLARWVHDQDHDDRLRDWTPLALEAISNERHIGQLRARFERVRVLIERRQHHDEFTIASIIALSRELDRLALAGEPCIDPMRRFLARHKLPTSYRLPVASA